MGRLGVGFCVVAGMLLAALVLMHRKGMRWAMGGRL